MDIYMYTPFQLDSSLTLNSPKSWFTEYGIVSLVIFTCKLG